MVCDLALDAAILINTHGTQSVYKRPGFIEYG